MKVVRVQDDANREMTRLGKILNGKTSSPFDAVREGE
jgi:hypothetical protein